MREKRDPPLIRREPLVVEIALSIRRDDLHGRIASLDRARDGNQARRVSFGPTESTCTKNRLAVFRPVRPVHLDMAGLRQNALTAAIRIEHGEGESMVTAPHNERTPASRRPETSAIDEQPILARQSDLDNDGDLDVVINNLDGAPTVLRNDGGNAATFS